MAILDRFFGPTREEIWQQLADEVGGKFDEGAFWVGGSKVRAQVGKWIVTLDAYKDEHGNKFTRLRAPVVKSDDFVFTISREGSFKNHRDAKHLESGQSDFDSAFKIKSNNVEEVQKLFAGEKIRKLLARQPDVYFHVFKDTEHFTKEFPEGVDELCFQAKGEIKNLNRLKELYELFGETLDQLHRLGSVA